MFQEAMPERVHLCRVFWTKLSRAKLQGYIKEKVNEQQNYPQNTNYTILPTSTLATIILIEGILGFVGFPISGSMVAIWTGYTARKDTRSIAPNVSGDGMTTAGIVMGWIQIGLAVVETCFFIAYFVFVIGGISRAH